MLEKITEIINNKMADFTLNANKIGNKAAAARARKISNELTPLLKEFRKLSVAG